MEQLAYNISLSSYFAASLGYFLFLIYRKHPVSIFSRCAVALGVISQTIFMAIRSGQTGHGPYTNSFEVAFFCSWMIVVSYFFAELRYKIKDLGAFVIPLAFLILLYSFFLAQEGNQQDTGQIKIWMTLHRSLSIVGYAAFSMAFVAGVMYLIQENQLKNKKLGIMYFRMPSLELLDKFNFTVITLGFPLFTLGFMTGTLANSKIKDAIFSWDIVKTWPLVLCWLVYGLIFFGRLLKGWRGKKAAQGAILGFISVILTFVLHV